MRTNTRTAFLLTGLVAASSLVIAAPAAKSGPHKRNPGCVPIKPIATTTSAHAGSSGIGPSSYNKKGGYSVPVTWLASEGEFTAKVKVGGQEMNIEFDTGSGDFFVMSTNQKKNTQYYNDQAAITYYDPRAAGSKFTPKDGLSMDTKFADNTVVNCSTVGTETIQVGGLTVPNQGISLVDVATGSWQRGGRDGVIGLNSKPNMIDASSSNGFPPASLTHNPVQNAFSQGLISNRTIAAYFNGNGGSYDIGMIDQEKYTGEMKWVNNPGGKNEGYWKVPFTSFTTGSKTVNGDPKVQELSTAWIDTGSTLNYVTADMAKALYDQVDGAKENGAGDNLYSVPCDAKMPTMSLKFGDAVIEVPNTKEVMIRGPVDGSSTECFPSFQPSDDLIQMGTYFMRGIYTVFDYGDPTNGNPQMRIGFATRK